MWIRLLGRSHPLQRRSFCPCTSGFLLYHRLRLFSPGFSFSVLLLFFLPTRNSFKIMQIRHPCHYFLAPPRREANFCTNRSALKINVGWRHFIPREKRSIATPSYLGIERLSRTLLPGFYDRSADLCTTMG